jgi:glycosyltransferase involved in cell wall biosynthesis
MNGEASLLKSAVSNLTSSGNSVPAIGQRGARVLHVIEATLGGSMRYLDTVISTTAGLPFEFSLAYSTLRATPALEIALEKAHDYGWRTFRIEMTRNIAPWRDFRSAVDLVKLYKRLRPDIVHCHSSKAGALGRLAALSDPFHRPRLIYTPHAVAARLGKQYLMAERALVPLTTRMVAVSDSEAEELIALKLTSPGNFNIVHPVVDCDYFFVHEKAAARFKLGLPLDLPIIVGVGRMTAQKGPLVFLSILKQVIVEFPQARGIWVGDGELKDQFLQDARQHGLEDKVTVTGWQDDVRPWIAAADLLLSTSEYESFGYMVAEALAMERPVVATNVTGTCDIMREELAPFLYPARDTTRAADLIGGLLRSPGLSLRCGRIGREKVAERFASAAMRNSLEALYAQLSYAGH